MIGFQKFSFKIYLVFIHYLSAPFLLPVIQTQEGLNAAKTPGLMIFAPTCLQKHEK